MSLSTLALTRSTWLGLAISESIVRTHGGTITCDSLEGQGATFTVTLPLRPPEKVS